jgi:hypothetical protein
MSATRIDIEEELAAIANGECAACRIHGTHKANPACHSTPANKGMALCNQCGHYYSVRWFTGCPVCAEDVATVKRN